MLPTVSSLIYDEALNAAQYGLAFLIRSAACFQCASSTSLAEYPRYLRAAAKSSLELSSTVTRPLIFSRYLGSKTTAQVSVGSPSSLIFWSLYPMTVSDIAYGTEYLLPGSNGVFRYAGSMFFRLGSCALSICFNCPPLISAWTAFEVGTRMSYPLAPAASLASSSSLSE